MSKAEVGGMKDERGHVALAHVVHALLFILLPSSFILINSGCNIVGAIASKASPPPTVKAQYKPPATEPVLAVVENPHNPASVQLESDAIARMLTDQLKVHTVAPVVDSSEIESLRQSKGAGFRHMPIDEIGRSLGAKQVIYVNLERFEVERAAGSEMPGGNAEARVRVVSADDGAVLWPIDSAQGYPLMVKVQPEHSATVGAEQSARQRLQTELAERVAKLFYDWQDDDSSEAANANSQR